MDLHLNVPVRCTDGDGGQTTRLVVNPLTRVVTDIVVRGPGRFDPERLVPVESVATSTPEAVALRLTRKELRSLQRFFTDEFVDLPQPVAETSWGNAVYWPYVAPTRETLDLPHPTIPLDELAMRRGDRAEATDGLVGHVDGFLVDPATEAITGLILRQGHFWGQHDVTLPVKLIASIDSGVVRLSADKAAIAAELVAPAGVQ